MTGAHQTKQPHPPMNHVEKLLCVLRETYPDEGHLVLTAWISPSRLSDEDRLRLHEHLIEAHGAVSILTVGLSTTA